MPKPTFHNLPDDKRMRVVEAAIDEFAARGYAKASITQICAAADIAKGSFYQYFDSKIDLYRWLVTDELGRRKVIAMKDAGVPNTTGLFDVLEHAAVAGMRWAMDHPRLARAAQDALVPSAQPELVALAAELRRAGQRGLRALLEQAQQNGEVRSDSDLDLGAALLASCMRDGLDAVVYGRLGVSAAQLYADPTLSAQVDDATLHELVHALLDFLARGIGSGVGGTMSLDLDEMRHQMSDDATPDPS